MRLSGPSVFCTHCTPSWSDQGRISACVGLSQQLFYTSLVLRRSEIQQKAFGMACITSLHVSCVLRWSGRNGDHGQLRTASLHTSCFLKRSGTNTSKVGSTLTASLHISWVFKWSGTSINNNGYFSTALMHMSCFLERSGIFINEHRSFSTTLLHISYVLKWSGTSTNDHGSFFDLFITHFLCFEIIWGTHFIWLEARARSKYTLDRWFLYRIIFKIDYLILYSINDLSLYDYWGPPVFTNYATFSHQPTVFNSARITYFFVCVGSLDTSTNVL